MLIKVFLASFVFACFSFFACTEKEVAKSTVVKLSKIDQGRAPASMLLERTPSKADLEQHNENYKRLKSKIVEIRQGLRDRTDLSAEDKSRLAEQYMSKLMIDSIFSYWEGTKWDFNGISETPRSGEVACGYFVSTTLRDLGVKLNRYKIAQKGATDIIKSLCDGNSIVRSASFEKLEKQMSEKEDYELLIVGLDFHVGFLFRKEGKSYFAHSNYINSEGVVVEVMEESVALRNSNAYVLGSFSKNKQMNKQWLD